MNQLTYSPIHGYSAIPERDYRARWARRLDIGSKTLLAVSIIGLAVVALRQLALVIG